MFGFTLVSVVVCVLAVSLLYASAGRLKENL